MRAGVYIRVSTESQSDDDKASVSAQRTDSEAVCERHDYVISDEYSDTMRYRATRGKDGGKMVEPSSERRDRPRFLNLCEDIRQGKIDVIVCQSWDRIAAGGAVEVLLDAIDDSGRDVVIHTNWEGTMNKMMLRIFCAMRSEENERRRKRVMMAGKDRLESGRAYGGYFRFGYNYDAEAGTWILNEDEAPWVLKIFQWYIGGITMKEISRRLVQNDVIQRKQTKKPWERRILQKILRNPAYKGIVPVKWGGQTYELECPPIVSPDLWRGVQDKLDASSTWQNHNVKMNYLLSGLIKCGVCGNRLSSTGARFRYERGKKTLRKTPVRRYQCRSCGTKSVNARLLEECVWEEVLSALIDPNKIRGQIEERIQEMQENREERQEEADKLTAKLEKLGGEREWVITQARKRIISQGDYENQIALLTIERQELERELSEVSVDVDIDIDPLEVLNEHFFKGERWGELLDPEPDFDLQKQTLRTLVDEIIIYQADGKLEIRGTFNRVVLFQDPQACLRVLDWNLWTSYVPERMAVDVPGRQEAKCQQH